MTDNRRDRGIVFKFSAMVNSIKAQLDPTSFSIVRFIKEKTFLKGVNFSFKGHEFQEYCVRLMEDNPGCQFAISKPSQIGMSEVIYRVIMAMLGVLPDTSIVLSMPSLALSQEVFKTRLTGIINGSSVLRDLRDSNNDSASVKAFHNNSILYGLSGSENSKSSLINRPVSKFFIDECDRQSRDVYSGYISRQTHVAPKDRCTVFISTPTVADFGIDREVKECGIHHEPLTVCACCGHAFLPDYYVHVVIPEFTGDLRMLTKESLSKYRIDDAYLECPECKGDTDKDGGQGIKWVVTKNEPWPETSIGIKLNPWVAHDFIKIPTLIRTSTTFTSEVEWMNQGLGLTATSKDSSIDRSSIRFTVEEYPAGRHIYGLDMGKMCTFMHGVLKPDTSIRVVDSQEVTLADLELFLEAQHKEFPFVAAVMDQGPMVDMAYKLVRKYEQLFSCVYVTPNAPMPELYKLKMIDKYDQLVRQLSMNHTLGFDNFMGMLKDLITFAPTPMEATILEHFLSLRRIRDYNRPDGIWYKWVKTSRIDHFAHAYIYMCLASKMANSGISMTYSLPFEIRKIVHAVKEDAPMRIVVSR